MVYTEWLRVRNCLRITGIVLVALFALAAIARVAISNHDDYDAMIGRISSDSTAKTTRTVLPDGTRRTTIQDIRDGSRVVITEPTGEAHDIENRKVVSVGSVLIERSGTNGSMSTLNVDTDGPTDFAVYAGFGLIVAFILATIFGAPFARENDGHLEIALTKPISRIALALEMMGVDALAIVAGTLFSIVVWIAIGALFERPHIVFSPMSLLSLESGLAVALAWYAMLAAATASLKRSYGAILGLAWPVTGAIVLLSHVSFGDTTVGNVARSVVSLLAHIDPVAYLTQFAFVVSHDQLQTPAPLDLNLAMVLLLLVAYVVLAVFQWRRVEA